jgi:hypothetical protein
MTDPEKQIAQLITNVMTDGFNRSLNVLLDEGAIRKTKKMNQYSGVGSELYDKVTEQMEMTVEYSKPEIRKLIEQIKAD